MPTSTADRRELAHARRDGTGHAPPSRRAGHGIRYYAEASRGRSSEAEHELPKLATRVRFPSPAPLFEASGQAFWVR
ncbi:hypothetical protein FAGKG844_70030 [Frankia sp. AgKG'84/4]